MCLNCQTINLSIPPNQLEAELKRIAKLVHEGKLRPNEIDAAMVKKIAKQMMAGVNKGYGTASTAIDKSFLAQVENNVFVFSGFKTHQMLREASLMLKDGDTIKPFQSFLNDIKTLNNTYNEVYAAAEYSNAVASMQAASSWNDYIENGVDMLRFQSINDDRTRPEHAIMDGTTVPIGDPLLDTYYTPLDWGCRCEWVPAIGETRKVNTDLPTVPPMFQNNVAKTGIIFPDTHPYFNVSTQVAESILTQVDEIKVSEGIIYEDIPEFYPPALDEYKKTLGVEVNNEVFTFLKAPVPLTNRAGNGACYIPNEKRVNIPISERVKQSKYGSAKVVYHEFGHAADWQHGYRASDEVKTLMAKYKKEFRKDGNKTFADVHYSLLQKRMKIGGRVYGDDIEQIGAVADTLMALNPKYGWGHTAAYFKNPYMKEAEFIAHAFENKFIGNPIFKELMPGLYDDMIKLVDDLKKLNK